MSEEPREGTAAFATILDRLNRLLRTLPEAPTHAGAAFNDLLHVSQTFFAAESGRGDLYLVCRLLRPVAMNLSGIGVLASATKPRYTHWAPFDPRTGVAFFPNVPAAGKLTLEALSAVAALLKRLRPSDVWAKLSRAAVRIVTSEFPLRTALGGMYAPAIERLAQGPALHRGPIFRAAFSMPLHAPVRVPPADRWLRVGDSGIEINVKTGEVPAERHSRLVISARNLDPSKGDALLKVELRARGETVCEAHLHVPPGAGETGTLTAELAEGEAAETAELHLGVIHSAGLEAPTVNQILSGRS
ncbi:MAG: hypothetical protein H5T86_07730 [Armatimonadetes bacterium]|nr:hypothetical protein [Armatimonadota bacterium]